MKTDTTKKKNILHRLMRLTGMVLIAILMVPAVGVCQSPAVVNLGTAGNFVILAKTEISTTGTTHITGDIGISPSAASYITGFGLIMDVSNTFSTSSLITGNAYAADYTPPTPTQMTTTVGDMETAYTDAAGRTLPTYTELYTGNLTGHTLTPGLYNWSSGVQVASAGVTISGSATDIWIFQIAQNLELSSGAIVTLSGGAQASNIFWQVAGQVTLGTTVEMKGIILCKTQIVMSTGSTLIGRALAQTAVTLDASVIYTASSINNIGAGLKQTPAKFTLEQNYPNPFNPSTLIKYSIPQDGIVKLYVFNSQGQKVAVLVNQQMEAGDHEIKFNASNLSSGVYFYRIEAGNFNSAKKLMLLK
jgi:hypothetical protein